MRRITTTKAGQILGGVSGQTVRNLVERGQLKDYGETAPGKSRHEIVLSSKEVREFAANNVQVGRQWVPVQRKQAEPKAKRPKVTTAPATAPEIPSNGKVTTGSGEGLLARLDRIEKFLFG